ncbi:hypothetical protein GCM10011491_30260 [Brucella endophytica]|uniref:Uncharacterized protein n=1 Tax=Brucella endophytica TaxID=1963359 RepID=A0A916WIA8_9HYPH|nr:hypothetical protein [Brucella endophytica]GGA99967.1 hypothetical protein GCM10011491_30260 [Brucella endophytica]
MADQNCPLAAPTSTPVAAIREQALEEAARLIDENMLCGVECEVLLPRTNPGNKVGLVYAEAIRALKSTPVADNPAPSDKGLETVAREMSTRLRSSPDEPWGDWGKWERCRASERSMVSADELYERRVRTLTPTADAEREIAARDAEIAALKQVNANLMGDDEGKPRYTTKRLKQEIERATAEQAARIKELERKADEYYGEAVVSYDRKLCAETAEARVREQDAEIAALRADKESLDRQCEQLGIIASDRFEHIMELRAQILELEAAQQSYADLFDGDAGSIHENIRALKADFAALREDASKVYEWLREPDWSGEWSTIDWLNRRPIPQSFAKAHDEAERAARDARKKWEGGDAH